ncbi:MAG: formate transporter FocA [Rhodobacteraceae bacterium]|nr:formate transporter FocA [Paracoccaceae bacterium]
MTQISPTGLDAHKPAEIALLIEQAGVTKARLGLVPLITLSVLAGVFISFGALFFTQVTAGFDTLSGPVRLLGGAAFSLGLILVVVGGGELFTGNAMIVMAVVDRRVTILKLLRNWSIVFAGNLAGSLSTVLLVAGSGLLEGALGDRAIAIAEAKVTLSPVEALCRGILCNALVCLAIWLAASARTTMGKIMSILWPITAFVAVGLEHSIANLYLIPVGMAAGAQVTLAGMVGNLVPVLIGNVIGGAGGVALSYRLAYGPPTDKPS